MKKLRAVDVTKEFANMHSLNIDSASQAYFELLTMESLGNIYHYFFHAFSVDIYNYD